MALREKSICDCVPTENKPKRSATERMTDAAVKTQLNKKGESDAGSGRSPNRSANKLNKKKVQPREETGANTLFQRETGDPVVVVADYEGLEDELLATSRG